MGKDANAGPLPWEIELARSVALRYWERMDVDELAGELFVFLLKLRGRKTRRIADWEAYLAKSLLRRADRIVKRQETRRRRSISLDSVSYETSEGRLSLRLRDLLSREDPEPGALPDILAVYRDLPADMRTLWDLLIEEGWNTSRAARRLGRPRKTVEYHIRKLRKLLRKRGCPS